MPAIKDDIISRLSSISHNEIRYDPTYTVILSILDSIKIAIGKVVSTREASEQIDRLRFEITL